MPTCPETIKQIQEYLISKDKNLKNDKDELQSKTIELIHNLYMTGALDRWEVAGLFVNLGRRTKKGFLTRHMQNSNDSKINDPDPWEEDIDCETIKDRTYMLVLNEFNNELGDILVKKFGLDGIKPYSLKDIAIEQEKGLGVIRNKYEKAIYEFAHSESIELISQWIYKIPKEEFKQKMDEKYYIFFQVIYSNCR